MSETQAAERIVENILLAPPRSKVEIDFFVGELGALGETDDLVAVLVQYQPSDAPDQYLFGLSDVRSAAREVLHDLGSHAYCFHDVPLLLRGEKSEARDRFSDSGSFPRWDTTTTDDDPNGYERLRAFLDAVADLFDELPRARAAEDLRAWIGSASLPSEWVGESALLIRRELATTDLPDSIRSELERCLASIRQGFIRDGRPNF